MLEFIGMSKVGLVLFLLWSAGLVVGTLFVARANKNKAAAVTDYVTKQIEETEKIIKKATKKGKK